MVGRKGLSVSNVKLGYPFRWSKGVVRQVEM